MESPEIHVKELLSSLIARLASKTPRTVLDDLVVRLDAQYPGGDIGVFCALFLNYVVLTPGDAIFLAANEPHAYLSGGNT
jgi:mannose-6-phosphate isomerase